MKMNENDNNKFKDLISKLEETDDFVFEIQGQLNIVDDAITKISGGLLHNLQCKIYELQDLLKPEEQPKEQEVVHHHCYDLE